MYGWNIFGSPSEVFDNLWLSLEPLGNVWKSSENIRKHFSDLQTNFGKFSEILGKWLEIFGKLPKRIVKFDTMKKRITWSLGDLNFLSHFEKYFTCSLHSLGKYIFLTLELKINFVSLHSHVISSMYFTVHGLC